MIERWTGDDNSSGNEERIDPKEALVALRGVARILEGALPADHKFVILCVPPAKQGRVHIPIVSNFETRKKTMLTMLAALKSYIGECVQEPPDAEDGAND